MGNCYDQPSMTPDSDHHISDLKISRAKAPTAPSTPSHKRLFSKSVERSMQGQHKQANILKHLERILPQFQFPGEYDDGRTRQMRVEVPGPGYIYSGEWEAGIPSGKGIFLGENGLWKYHGYVHEGKPHFYGRLYNLAKRHVVQGKLVSGNFHGPARVNKQDGTFFQGLFHNGALYHGLAEYPDGSSYSGEFKKDMPCGSGIYSWKDGTIYQGYFEKGVPQGEGKMIIGGVTHSGYFQAGECSDSSEEDRERQAMYQCYKES